MNFIRPRLFLGRAVKIADWLFLRRSCRKNSTAAIFMATVTIKIPDWLFLWQRTNSKEGAQSVIHSLPEINLNINFKAQNRKTKTDTNPIPDPNQYWKRCPDPEDLYIISEHSKRVYIELL